MIDYLETLLAEEEEWESALGLPRWPRRGRENDFSRKTGKGRWLLAPDAGQRGATAEAWSLEERRRTGGEDVLETIEQAAQEMVSLTEQVRPRPGGGGRCTCSWDRPRQIAQAAMGGREVTPFCVDGIPGAENDSRLRRIGPGGAAGCPAV